METSEIPVILLKTKSHPADPYGEYFSAHPLEADVKVPLRSIFVPVLQHRHVNLEQVQRFIQAGKISSEPNEKTEYYGLIITSQRAVEALGVILAPLKESNPAVLKLLLSSTKIYVVGPATNKAIVQLGFSEQNVLGRHCGDGAALAEYILEDYNTSVPDGHRLPLLFLVGETRRDIIPKTLTSASENRRIALKELVVYETEVVHSFHDDFQAVMKRTALGGADGDMPNIRVVVVFSPAGADIAVDVLNGLKTGCGTVLASIGPTTQERLESLRRAPDIVAKHPSPEGLWNGIADYMKLKERSVQAIPDTA